VPQKPHQDNGLFHLGSSFIWRIGRRAPGLHPSVA
jgi:hypothetical protein